MSYTDRQYEIEYERYKNAPRDALRKVKSTLHFQFHLTSQQEARLAVVEKLFREAQADYRREYARTYHINHPDRRAKS